ncbi:MAG: trigger factor [Candidatus Nealsonbacteria bacterium CG23_combo_of_CG06-09_8_20_14_all_36_12]|uniref:Trigger factor n=1 Tax=Candidatus Nealsonbacteria bacterium CG23_combo_of_CG06-09_8_20_14_all_36_12 TaxID=1974718 RepID=A0A2G9Z0I1_9BACT|nr:MAG: trigger factor [Candidatus Nealsonbacteria bacterium CG23_combo_of_CG06-09_8_20_14_all_36_12]
MKTTIQKLPKSQIEIFFEIPAEEFKDYFEEAILNLGREIEIEGFRKGKAPKKIIEEKIGPGKVLEEVASLAVKKSYIRAILENKIEAIGRPEIQITKIAKENPLEFKAKVFILPEVNLPDYKKIALKIKPKEIPVEEKEVDEAISLLQKSRAKLLAKDGACEIGDFVEISFQSQQIEGGEEKKDSFILGQGRFIPGFEEELFGMKPGSEKEFSLNFPKNYFNKNLAGKPIDFQVKMISISKIELPEINDDWAKSLGNFENLESLKKNIQEGIKMEKTEEEKQRNRGEILEKIKENASLEIPEILIDYEKGRMIEELKTNLQNQFQMNFNDYLSRIKKTEKEISDSFLPESEKRVKNFLILREIAKREEISVSDEEIKEKISETLKSYPNVEKAEKELARQNFAEQNLGGLARQNFAEQNLGGLALEKLKEYYEGVIRNEKVFQFLESFIKP